MTTLGTSYKSNVTAKSVLEKLKSLSTSASKRETIKGSIEDIPGFSDDSLEMSASKPTTNIIMRIIRYLLILLLVGFILLNIFAVLGLLPPDLAKFFNPLLVFLGHSPDVTYPKVKSNKKSAVDSIKSTIKSKKKSTKPKEDNAGSDVQLARKPRAGYCYVGKDRGYRSCVKVDENNICMSGDIFPTMDVCINPKLRSSNDYIYGHSPRGSRTLDPQPEELNFNTSRHSQQAMSQPISQNINNQDTDRYPNDMGDMGDIMRRRSGDPNYHHNVMTEGDYDKELDRETEYKFRHPELQR